MKRTWTDVARTCMTSEQAAAFLGVPTNPDRVRSWRTWWRWRLACKQHHLIFDDAWEYAKHWHAEHDDE